MWIWAILGSLLSLSLFSLFSLDPHSVAYADRLSTMLQEDGIVCKILVRPAPWGVEFFVSSVLLLDMRKKWSQAWQQKAENGSLEYREDGASYGMRPEVKKTKRKTMRFCRFTRPKETLANQEG